MRIQKVAPVFALALTLTMGVAVGADDGTGGPEMATPNPEGCTRDLITAEVFEQFEQPDSGIFSGSIDTVTDTDVAARDEADAVTIQAIDETLRAYGACISKFGPIGAYAFFDPEISVSERIFLGVSGVTLEDATPLAESEAGTIVPASSLVPERVIVLDDGRVGAVLPSSQPGTEFTMFVFRQDEGDGQWMIEAVMPVVAESEGGEGGGGGGP